MVQVSSKWASRIPLGLPWLSQSASYVAPAHFHAIIRSLKLAIQATSGGHFNPGFTVHAVVFQGFPIPKAIR